MVTVSDVNVCNGHTDEVIVTQDDGSQSREIDCCEFPLGFAYSKPPVNIFTHLDELSVGEWWAWCDDNQPDPDEQLVMDLEAISLKAELESVL